MRVKAVRSRAGAASGKGGGFSKLLERGPRPRRNSVNDD
jgi:hypothetical protein